MYEAIIFLLGVGCGGFIGAWLMKTFNNYIWDKVLDRLADDIPPHLRDEVGAALRKALDAAKATA